MGFRGVGIIVWKGKAYLPSYAQHESGIFVQVKPVYVSALNDVELLSAVEKILASDIKVIPTPSKEEWKRRKDPLLAATGAKSWMELARNGRSYGIEWTPEGIRLDTSRLDKKGRWEIDPNKIQMFPTNTPTSKIIDIILDDISRNIHLLNQ